MEDKKITLELNVSEVNAVLQALGGMPYGQVFQLVQAIQQQAKAQLDEPKTEA